MHRHTTTPAAFENGVLYLRPGEAVRLTVGDERLKYYVEEIQIDPDMWDRVDINHAPATMLMDGTGTVKSDNQAVAGGT